MKTQLAENLCMVILGKAGTGKSLLARAITARYMLEGYRDYIVVVTAKRDWSEPLPPVGKENLEIDMSKLGFVTVALTKEEVPETEPPDLTKVLATGKKVIFFDQGLSPDRRRIFLEGFGEALLKLGNALLVVDEAEKFYPRSGTSERFPDVLRQGRYKGIDMIIITHADTGVHPEVMQEANAVLSFAIQHPTRIERLRYYFDDPKILSALGRYEYIIADDNIPERILWNSTKDLRELRAEAPEIFAT